MKIRVIPALQDNYMYLLVDQATSEAAAVDPVEPEKIVQAVDEEKAKLTTVLTTHHHWDHASGNEKLVSLVPGLTVCGNDDRIGAMNKRVKHSDQFNVGELRITALETPCHTSGHICYYVLDQDRKEQIVFTGDTLFTATCGRFFEGTAAQMYKALFEVLLKLPLSTRVYCGHNYLQSSLRFAAHVEPDNVLIKKKLEWAKIRQENQQPTVPSSIEEVLEINPFTRVHEPAVQKHCGKVDPIEVIQFLRNEKDNF
jgi:hydroxyacylglutathione hydrolase